MNTRVGVIGAGAVGSTLGKRLQATQGFAVRYGAWAGEPDRSRDPGSAKVQELLAAQPGATADTVTAVADWAQVLVLATPSWEPERAGEQIAALAVALGPGAGGKALIDVVNGVSGWPALCLPWEGGPSTSELLAQALPGTAVFKAFSTVGVEQLAAPDGSRIDGRRLTMLLAGPPERRAEAEAVVAGVGFAPKYVGPIRYARNLDAIAELWIHLSIPGAGETPECWGRNFHFQVIEGPHAE